MGITTSLRANANPHGMNRIARVDESRTVDVATLEPGHTAFCEKRLGTVGSFETATSVAAEANIKIIPNPQVFRIPAIYGRKKLKKQTLNQAYDFMNRKYVMLQISLELAIL